MKLPPGDTHTPTMNTANIVTEAQQCVRCVFTTHRLCDTQSESFILKVILFDPVQVFVTARPLRSKIKRLVIYLFSHFSLWIPVWKLATINHD